MHSINWYVESLFQRFKFGRVLVTFSPPIAFLLMATSTMAASEGCKGVYDSLQENLLISRLIAAGLRDAEQTSATNYAYLAADSLSYELTADLKVRRFHVVNCDRLLNIDGSDFDEGMLSQYRQKHVLFEVWGSLVTTKRNTETVAADGFVSYYLIPKPDSDWRVPAQLMWVYRDQNVKLDKLYNRIFRQGRLFEILAAIAHGIEQSHNHKYDDAQAAFCKAKVLVNQNLTSSIWRDLHIETQVVTAGIEGLARHNRLNAKVDDTYVGALRNLPEIQTPEGNICPS
jgi:hypothetical protein